MDNTIYNAKISATQLGELGRGFSSFIMLDMGDNGHQGFGGHALHGEYAHKWISRVLQVLEIEKWEDLKGVPCRVDGTRDGLDGIGHLLKDQWFYPGREWE